MHLSYLIDIVNPSQHRAKITLTGDWPTGRDHLVFFLPVWSPGSYLIREYAKHVQRFIPLNVSGEYLNFFKISKNSWRVDRRPQDTSFSISYEVYAHELSVRTSHIDTSHAFLHGPSLFMGIENSHLVDLKVKIKFPNCWSKISTSLTDISSKRDDFLYTAKDYDTLIDSPIEIGCQETNGFLVKGVPHEICIYGEINLPHKRNLLEDTKKIVEHISEFMDSLPYDKYTFIILCVPNLYGGLEHKNSMAILYPPDKLCSDKGHTAYLHLIAHEYFHTWNVKRIRPREFDSINYHKENYTSLHWLTEGLTDFMSRLFLLRAKLITLDDYLPYLVTIFNIYLKTPGRKMQSLEEASYDAWIRCYRPDENSQNSSISYYIQGAIVFLILHISLSKEGSSIDDFIRALWKKYLINPNKGLEKEEILRMIPHLEIREFFRSLVETTVEIDLSSALHDFGLEIIWKKKNLSLGVSYRTIGDRVILSQVFTNSAAERSQLNAGDEIIAIGNMRIFEKNFSSLADFIIKDHLYPCLICRNGSMKTLPIQFREEEDCIEKLKIIDRKKLKL